MPLSPSLGQDANPCGSLSVQIKTRVIAALTGVLWWGLCSLSEGFFFPSTPERSQKHSALPCLLCARLLRCQAAHLEECSSQRAVTPLLGNGNSSCGGSDSQHPQGTPWGWHSSIIAPLDQFGMDTLLLPRTKPRCGAGVPWRGCAPAWKCRNLSAKQKPQADKSPIVWSRGLDRLGNHPLLLWGWYQPAQGSKASLRPHGE